MGPMIGNALHDHGILDTLSPYHPRGKITSMAARDDIRTRPDSEYGGASGLVQPPPHVPYASEIIGMMKRDDDPADPQSGQAIQDRFESAG